MREKGANDKVFKYVVKTPKKYVLEFRIIKTEL